MQRNDVLYDVLHLIFGRNHGIYIITLKGLSKTERPFLFYI